MCLLAPPNKVGEHRYRFGQGPRSIRSCEEHFGCHSRRLVRLSICWLRMYGSAMRAFGACKASFVTMLIKRSEQIRCVCQFGFVCLVVDPRIVPHVLLFPSCTVSSCMNRSTPSCVCVFFRTFPDHPFVICGQPVGGAWRRLQNSVSDYNKSDAVMKNLPPLAGV